jgi:hypothetical protein
MFLIILGFVVNAIAGVVILIKAFKVSVGWGLAVMFLPFAALFFVIKNWDDTKTPFLVGIGGGVLMFLGIFATATTAPNDETPTVASQTEATEPPQPSYAAAAATPVSYEPSRTSYAPTTTYTPSYAPPAAPAPAPLPVTETQPPEDEWQRKPKLEQVYVDRDTFLFYGEKCKKRPENVYRIPRTIAVAQGLTEAKCR